MKKFFSEFKDFISRGNVMNLAVGVLMGAAFQSIVASLTENLIAPIIGLFAKANLDELHFEIANATFRYGAFLTAVINFIITAFIIFLIVKGLNKLASIGKKEQEEKKTTKACLYCCSEISIKATRCPNCTSQL